MHDHTKGYALNNPMKYTDPSGYIKISMAMKRERDEYSGYGGGSKLNNWALLSEAFNTPGAYYPSFGGIESYTTTNPGEIGGILSQLQEGYNIEQLLNGQGTVGYNPFIGISLQPGYSGGGGVSFEKLFSQYFTRPSDVHIPYSPSSNGFYYNANSYGNGSGMGSMYAGTGYNRGSGGGNEVTRVELGISANQTSQQQVQTLLTKMKVGDWLEGSEFSFIDKQLASALNSVTRISTNTFSLQAKGLAKAFIKSNATLTIENTSLTINKVQKEVFKITINGVKVPGANINSYYLSGDKLYFYENGKLYFIETKTKK